ncbi:MAG: COG1361 S-layer family protein [Methanosarcinales archaeon]
MKYLRITLKIVLALALLTSTILLTSAESGQFNKYDIGKLVHDYYDVKGHPYLTASIYGSDTFQRGEEVTLHVMITNEGEILSFEANEDEFKEDRDIYGDRSTDAAAAREYEMDREVTTALSITAHLSAGNAPVDITGGGGTALVGMLAAGTSSGPIDFKIKINDDAPAGTYKLILNTTYRYQEDSAVDLEGNRSNPIQNTYFSYKNAKDTSTLTIKVKELPLFKVVKVDTSELMAGSEGILSITFKNIGEKVAKDAIARISNVQYPFTLIDSESFLGNLNPGDTAEAKLKVSIDQDAIEKNYGLKLEIEYKDEHGYTRTDSNLILAAVRTHNSSTSNNNNNNISSAITVYIKKKAEFEIVNVNSDFRAGSNAILHITFKNTGDRVAKDAVARISAVDPFSSTDDQSFLGTLNPGQTAEAKFKISIDKDATPKTYGINCEIKYNDEQGDSQISDIMKAPVEVKPAISIREILMANLWIFMILVVVLIGGYVYKVVTKYLDKP